MKSRLPEIERKLGPAVTKALEESANRIARRAAVSAPVRTGALKASLESPDAVRPLASEIRGRPVTGFGVYAAWYWFFQEFGTKNQAAQPFVIPAAEVERPKLLADVKKALGNL